MTETKTTTETRHTEVTRFWRHLFGGQRGRLAIVDAARHGTRLRDTRHTYFNYPKADKTAAEWALEKSEEGREVYFCAHLITNPKRIKKNAAPVRTLWGDLDGVSLPNGELKPTGVIESSPGNFHAYWRLDSEIPPETAEDLNKRMANEIGADPSGFDLSQLLRLPGTTNHKYPDKPTVRLVDLDSSRAYSAAKLDQILPASEEPENDHQPEGKDGGDEPPVALSPAALKVYRGESPKLKGNGEIDRSTSLVKIGRVLYDAGANCSVVVAALQERDKALGWRCYSDRRDAHKQYVAIFSELKRNGRSPSLHISDNPDNPDNPNNFGNPDNPMETFTASELMSREYAPTNWVVPNILPEGVTLLVGKPKKGKSWMALQMCEAVATGGVAFGVKRVVQGESLYLALEDNPKRLQKRLNKMLDGRDAPAGMHFSTHWPRLDEGGAELLDSWLDAHPETRLVVIDTLAKMRPPARGQNVYAEDYAALEKIMSLAPRHGINISVVHHLRKMAASDPMDEISSSTGLTAGVDGFLILRRTPGSKGPTLYVDGRDIEEPTEYALHWNMNTGTWTIEGEAEEVHLSKERADILLTLNRNGSPMTPKEVTDAMRGAKYNNVKPLMYAMLGAGQLLKDEKGRYSPANPTQPTDNPRNGATYADNADRVAGVAGVGESGGPLFAGEVPL